MNMINKIRVWALILLLYLIAGGLIFSNSSIKIVSNFWVAGIFIIVAYILFQVKKLDNIAAKNKKIKEKLDKYFIKSTKYFVIGIILIFVLEVITKLIEKYYSLNLSTLKTVLIIVIVVIFYFITWKKRICWFAENPKINK